MKEIQTMTYYHGTSTDYEVAISTGNVDITRGGGEFGQGFYVSDRLHLVAAWAWSKYKEKMSIVEFRIKEDEFKDLSVCCLSKKQARKKRAYIKKQKKTKLPCFKNFDVVIGPVVGERFINYIQTVFVSEKAENMINHQEADILWKK